MMHEHTYETLVAEAHRSEERLVRVERAGTGATVTMDDPERLNPLGPVLTVQLRDALAALAADPDLRTIVLTGTDPAFSAGGDLRMMVEHAQPMVADSDQGATGAWRWIRRQFGGVVRLITRTDKAFVAAVNGPAAGVGLSFALACDIVLLSERAQIVPAFGRIGLLPEVGQSWLLTRRLGYQRAFELYAHGRPLGAEEAHEIGIGNAVVPHGELLSAAEKWAERIDRLPAHVLEMMKPLLRGAADASWEQAIAMEEFAEPVCFTTRDHREGVEALLARS